MEFKQFIDLQEVLAIDTDKVDLQDTGYGLYCPFEYNGVEYKVSLVKEVKQLPWLTIPDTWSITFKGPEGYKLTKMAGTASSAIYSRMLACIKKLLDTHEVNAIEFSPAQEEMIVPYDLFSRAYLLPEPPKGKGFVQVSLSLFVKREFLDRNRDKLPESLDKVMDMVRKEVDSRVKHVKNLKAVQRQMGFAKTEEERKALYQRKLELKSSNLDRRSDFDSDFAAVQRRTRVRGAETPAEREERQEAEQRGAALSTFRHEFLGAAISILRSKADKVLVPKSGRTIPELGGRADYIFYSMPDDIRFVDLKVGRPMPVAMSLSPVQAATVVAMTQEASDMQVKQIAMKLHDIVKTGRRYEIEQRLNSMPPQLRSAIRGLGILPRAGLTVSRAIKGLTELPGEIKRYYLPGKKPNTTLPPPQPQEFSP